MRITAPNQRVWQATARWCALYRRQILLNAITFASALAVVGLFTQRYAVGLVLTDSVHASIVIIQKGVAPARDELAAFTYRGPTVGDYRPGDLFVKFRAGIPGDSVTVTGQNVYLNGLFLSRAKPVTRSGLPLTPTPTGVIPAGYFYAHSTHPDGLDSRYSVTGLIPDTAVIGRAVIIF
jgi:conjugal transfer pilin signal peptidase TrbI